MLFFTFLYFIIVIFNKLYHLIRLCLHFLYCYIYGYNYWLLISYFWKCQEIVFSGLGGITSDGKKCFQTLVEDKMLQSTKSTTYQNGSTDHPFCHCSWLKTQPKWLQRSRWQQLKRRQPNRKYTTTSWLQLHPSHTVVS